MMVRICILVFLMSPAFLAIAQEKSATDWEKKYKNLLQSDPAVRQKIENGQTTKEEIIQWLKSTTSPQATAKKRSKIDWEQRYKEFLESDPAIRRKMQNGEATKAQIIEYLKLIEGVDSKKNWGKSDAQKSGCKNSSQKGYHAIIDKGQQREYLLHVPKSYDRNQAHPLVINFHGFGDCASEYANNIGATLQFNSTANKNNFLVAYPQAAFREKGARYWEPGDNGTQNILTNDVYFTKQLIADIKKRYNINLSRVYAVGYSNGGMMAYDLACSKKTFIAAIGLMSGTMLGKPSPDIKSQTPVIHFHGIQDEVLPYQGNEHYQSVPSLVDSWRQHHSIPRSSGQRKTHNRGNVISESYLAPNHQTAIVLYTIKSEHEKPGGHVWFSDDIEGVHPNQIMWDFLSRYSLDN
ncbi:MAG: PHB depolymerase family esterase [Planctomycetota bacterium]|nr:PHB depolymerase family esterase [Planctomycetota bacterium]